MRPARERQGLPTVRVGAAVQKWGRWRPELARRRSGLVSSQLGGDDRKVLDP